MAIREREDRIDVTRQQRRRRDDTSAQATNKLAIPPEVEARLKAEGRTPRWANDEAGRIHRLTVLDDYDKVEGVEPVPTGMTTKGGEPIQAILLSKPTEFIEEDRSKAEQRRRDTEQGFLKGRIASKPGEEAAPLQGSHGAEMYVDKQAKIGRGNQIIE